MFNPSWRTSTVVALARQIRESRDYSILNILADALQDAGCDDPTLAALRDEGIVDSRSGLWLGGIEGKDGLWEWGQGWGELQPLKEPGRSMEGVCLECYRVSRRNCFYHKITARRTELRRLHTGECPDCGDTGKILPKSIPGSRGEGVGGYQDWHCANCGEPSGVYGHLDGKGGFSCKPPGDCPTCVLAVRERWDECRCPGCGGNNSRSQPERLEWTCPVCGGSGDLGWNPVPRLFDYSIGPLPVVSARVEEIAREEECESECPDCHGTKLLVPNPAPSARMARFCSMCQGRGVSTGRTWVPSEWLRSLPGWFDVMLEGVEPWTNNSRDENHWYRGLSPTGEHPPSDLPEWLFDFLEGGERINDRTRVYRVYNSPTAARLELCRAIRRWRFTS